MGTIIHLHPRERAATSLAIGDPPPPCEIVIFPGVRIERDRTAVVPGAAAPDGDGANHGNRPRKSS